MTISSDQIPSGNDPVQITVDDENMITINPTDSKFVLSPEIRNTGQLVYRVLPDGDKKLVAGLRQSPPIGEVPVEDWVFPVRINYGDEQLYVLLQRFKLCFVGFRASNGGWILPKGEYRDRVLECVNASFPASDTDGNFIEPILVDLDLSYRSLSKISNVPMTDLILNEQSFITAVVYLKDASLGNVLFDNRLCALHVLNLSQMLCEAAKIEPLSCFIRQNYFSIKTPKLTASLIKMQRLYTKASRKLRQLSNSLEHDGSSFLMENGAKRY
ncbi:hypothetical protein POM88_002129 [Heracleum sosnowskyi]|uniref:rRNA N-glycosylase n=1 Tax=Heracleum sosnowskyi TaxID=360622 RepID=A0AAD8JFJ8_9APIA|nr:hypothetical protein POM88_002129 [Heracleum sosnowskyi]